MADRQLNSSGLLKNYKNEQATMQDVLSAKAQFRGLACKRNDFVFNDGSNRNLLSLTGTIPVNYKGSTYNIPICIWLMDTHPNNAPICYVQPTSDMMIKVSMYVDGSGKVYLPYLHDWQPNSSDLLGLIQVLIITFGEFMPVYTKRNKVDPPKTPYPAQSFMPQPGGNVNPYMPYPQDSGNAIGQSYPPYPMPNAGNFPPYPGAGTPATTAGYPHPGMTGIGMGYPQPVNSNADNGTGTIREEHIKASLISAVEDKLRRRIQERVNQCQAEIETLNRTKQELTEGRAKINENISQLEREQNVLQSNITVLQDKQQALEKSLESIDKLNGIDVDEAVTTTAPLYKQLLNAYAEEAATEDAIYYMGEALRNGVIDLEVFLKHVRQLSRKQFMLRALMQKCRSTAGLAG